MIPQKTFHDLLLISNPTAKLRHASLQLVSRGNNRVAISELAAQAATTTDARTVPIQIKARDNHKARARANSVKAASHEEVDTRVVIDEAAVTKANDKTAMRGNEADVVNPRRLNSLKIKINDNDEAGV